MNAEDILYQEKYRCDFYKLLSDCFQIPCEEMIAGLEIFSRSNDSMNINAFDIPVSEDIGLLKIDHSRLFIGPYQLLAPPYGSTYLENDRTVMGNSTVNVMDMYNETGLDISDGFLEVPDHIIAELEFMYYLIFKELQAISDSNFESTMNYMEKQRDFLETHLGVWISGFSEKIEQNAETKFYKNLAKAIRDFVRNDLKYLEKTKIKIAD